jgi:hypothetical protein
MSIVRTLTRPIRRPLRQALGVIALMAILLLMTTLMGRGASAQDRDMFGYRCVVSNPSGTRAKLDDSKVEKRLKNGAHVVLRWWNPGQGMTGIDAAYLNADWVDKKHRTAGFFPRNDFTCDYERDVMTMPVAPPGSRYTDGKTLLGRCTSKKDVELSYCNGFAIGIANMQRMREDSFCIPNGTQLGTLVDVAVSFMRDRPDVLDKEAWWVFLSAYVKMYPCKDAIDQRSLAPREGE